MELGCVLAVHHGMRILWSLYESSYTNYVLLFGQFFPLSACVTWRDQGGAQRAGAPPSDLDTRLINVEPLTDSHLLWHRHRLYSCMQAKLKFKVRTLGIWSIRKSNYYSSSRVRTELWAMFISLKWKLQAPRWSATFKPKVVFLILLWMQHS